MFGIGFLGFKVLGLMVQGLGSWVAALKSQLGFDV